MELMQILAQALVDISKAETTAGSNDAAFRKQVRIIVNAPAVKSAVSRARDAPEGKTVRRRTAKAND